MIAGLYPVISTKQFSDVVGTVIVSAVIPTLVANKILLPDRMLETSFLVDRLPAVLKEKM
jgi:hypothetical protein